MQSYLISKEKELILSRLARNICG